MEHDVQPKHGVLIQIIVAIIVVIVVFFIVRSTVSSKTKISTGNGYEIISREDDDSLIKANYNYTNSNIMLLCYYDGYETAYDNSQFIIMKDGTRYNILSPNNNLSKNHELEEISRLLRLSLLDEDIKNYAWIINNLNASKSDIKNNDVYLSKKIKDSGGTTYFYYIENGKPFLLFAFGEWIKIPQDEKAQELSFFIADWFGYDLENLASWTDFF